jgi:phosphoribosylformylglycinamidine synthase I
MRFGVVVFPGSNCEQDCLFAARLLGHEASYVWHGDRTLEDFDCVILPGGFSYGDYLRTGAVARFSPVMDAVARYADAGGLVIGICNGFQILCEARLLPGALMRNTSLKFICKEVGLRVENSDTAFTSLAEPGQLLRIPINHNEGNYRVEPDLLERMKANGQVLLRYTDDDGQVRPGSAPNGAMDEIAGVMNERGNVFGLMPHPERAVDTETGRVDGSLIFRSIAESRLGAGVPA